MQRNVISDAVLFRMISSQSKKSGRHLHLHWHQRHKFYFNQRIFSLARSAWISKENLQKRARHLFNQGRVQRGTLRRRQMVCGILSEMEKEISQKCRILQWFEGDKGFRKGGRGGFTGFVEGMKGMFLRMYTLHNEKKFETVFILKAI